MSPWHWYFLNALPKSVTVSLPLIAIGLFLNKDSVLDLSLIRLLLPAFIFVGLYSFLPHKELWFIFPALTFLNIGAAISLQKLQSNCQKNWFKTLLYIGISGALVASLMYSSFCTYVSYHNYPGGNALKEFNRDFLRD